MVGLTLNKSLIISLEVNVFTENWKSGGAHSLIALRILMGISQGPIIPACLNLFSSWIPLSERSTIVSMAYGGITVCYLKL